MMAISVEILHRLLIYDPIAGTFLWRARTPDMFTEGKQTAAHKCAWWNARYAGKIAGSLDNYGYLRFDILGADYRAHRVAWAMMTGAWPEDEIDHEDGVTSICVWANLRESTHQQNRMNNKIYANNKSGHPGVAWKPDKKKWRARIRLANEDHHLGYFDTRDAAIAARQAGEERLFGIFRRAEMKRDNEVRELK